MRLQILTCLTSCRYSNSELREACRARPDIRDTFFSHCRTIRIHPSGSVRFRSHPLCPRSLSQRPDPEVRLARHSGRVWTRACFAPPSRSVGSMFQRRQHVSPEAKVLLADDLNAVVRGTIAKCRSLPPRAFDRLSCDSDLTVKMPGCHTRAPGSARDFLAPSGPQQR